MMTTTSGGSPHRAQWLYDARWGVFNHYLAASPELSAAEWNRQVDAFDVEALADTLSSVGAGYYAITIGQVSGHYCCPNPTYDHLVGIQPGKCSNRDLIHDLAAALEKRGIPLIAYLTSEAPAQDVVARERLHWHWSYAGKEPGQFGTETTGVRLAEFQTRWEQVIRDWSLRWGRSVKGWWFDSCYFADAMYRHPKPPNFASFAAAARAGNPEAILAFNGGVVNPIASITEWDDYTPGEVNEPQEIVVPGRYLGQAQYHVFSFLGPFWLQSPPRFSDDQAAGITRRLIASEAVVTWDVPITARGSIPESFVEQLRVVGRAAREVRRE